MKGHRRERILLTVGPTGVGKTQVAFELARQLVGEVVSADSRLIYRMMDIGTAKPETRMMKQVPHHMIDIVDPDEEYTCKRFEREAREVLQQIVERGGVPIVVGGSGLYVRALIEGIFEGPGKDDRIRQRLREEARAKGKGYLWQRLLEIDPEKAKRADPENMVRIIRALEVYELTGKRMSELEREAKPLDKPCVKFGLRRERQDLYRIIDERVNRMIETGFVDEVRNLIERGYGNCPAVRDSLGYREMLLHLRGLLPFDDTVDLIKRNTRRFAKRQMTWFRKERDVVWIDVTGERDHAAVAAEISERFRAV